jgi:hypothetical protein
MRWWHKYSAVGGCLPLAPVTKVNGIVGRILPDFFLFLGSKMCQKNQKMKLQKRYLEVSSSIRDEVRAFFRFTAEWKKYEFFQMSQKRVLKFYVA